MQTVKFIYDTGSTTENTITIKDLSVEWEQALWGFDGYSITGKRRNRVRSYKPVITIQFEHDDQLRTVAKEIYDTLESGEVFLETDDYYFSVAPQEFSSTHEYQNQIRRKPSTMVLVGDLQNIGTPTFTPDPLPDPKLLPIIVSLTATPTDEGVELCYEIDDRIPTRKVVAIGDVVSSGIIEYRVEATPGTFNKNAVGNSVSSGTVTTSTLSSTTQSAIGTASSSGTVTTSAESAINYGDVPTVCKTATGLRVEWVADAGADNYNLQRRVDSGSWTTISTGFIGTTFNDSYPASVPTSSIEYRVSACTSFGCGAYGDPSISTTYNSAISC